MPYLLAVIRRRKAILLHLAFIVLAAWIYVFFFTIKEFESEIVFLPPSSESSLGEVLQGISLPSATSSDILPEQIETIFSSKTIKRRIIDNFNLYAHYKMEKDRNKFENTLKCLKKSLMLGTSEKSGMGYSKTISFSLSVYHTSPDTACQMVNFAFSLLDSAVKSISVDRAHRNRVFIEGQLEKNKMILDTFQKKMQNYQIQNKAYDIPEQVRMSIGTYANLKAAMIANEIQIQTVKNEFSGETPELKALQKSHQAYQTSLSRLESHTTPDAMPSLSIAAKLLPQYTNLLRDIEVQNQVILLITREVEQAKIKEARNVSALVVIDPAFKPEYKSRPKRIVTIAVIVGMYMAFVILLNFYRVFYRLNIKNKPSFQAIISTWREKH
jgi:uncharacterized protein involved in exopolysaccharide biosynthesis